MSETKIGAGMEVFYRYLRHGNLDYQPHQIDGVRWTLANELCETPPEGVRGGLIADEMGLGKTIQILGTIVGNFLPRTLIVLPLALLDQWEGVIIKTLGHHPLIYHGDKKKEITIEQLKKSPIVLTTYGLISTDKSAQSKTILHMVKWDRLVFDEAHHLRNITRAYIGAMKLRAKIRWLVTGTPIQNRKDDFYSLCAQMGLPSKYYAVTENLNKIVNNFILKRTKAQIGLELPKLEAKTLIVPWGNEKEKNLAEDIHSMLQFSRVEDRFIDNTVAALGIEGTLPLLLRARQACVYPKLMQKHISKLIKADLLSDSDDVREAINYCSKIDAIVKKIIERKDNQKSKMIFCHYRGEIDIIAERLKEVGLHVETFDGRTNAKDRNEILTQKADALILQIKTGCEGLNLQHFSEIYFVSPHWNPAVEDQAVARCHRIGQTSEVDVFRFEMGAFDEDTETRTLDAYCTDVQSVKRGIMTMLDEE